MPKSAPALIAAAIAATLGIGYVAAKQGGPSTRIVEIGVGPVHVRTESHRRPFPPTAVSQPVVHTPAPAQGRDAGGRLSQTCLPAADIRGAKIVALGAYEGGRQVALAFEGESHATGLIQVHGDRNGGPLVAVLSAYDPVIWDFSRFPRTRLRGILVYGYHGQGVAHVPADVPVRFTTNGAEGGCGRGAYAYKGGAALDALNEQVHFALGRDIDTFQGAYSPSAFHMDGGGIAATPLAAIPSPKSIRGSAAISTEPVQPGDAGLDQLVRAGLLRPAHSRDVDAWNSAATRHSRTGRLAPSRSDYLRPGDAFVVLGPVELPRGMYGAGSRSFIIPPGVPKPEDPGSHNSFYFLDSGTCTGAAC